MFVSYMETLVAVNILDNPVTKLRENTNDVDWMQVVDNVGVRVSIDFGSAIMVIPFANIKYMVQKEVK